MRITPEQHKKSLVTLEDTFGKNTKIWLFGSRVHDDKRGGDVDIYAEAEKIPGHGKTLSEIETGMALEAIFDDGSVDLIVTYPGDQLKAIHKIAKKTGQRL
jgi:predicted nucleotidyltransferase